ncbi:MAG TPA: patatin-like phospholipase family protein, partial [Verrucomicrobiae bacterium]|nr:patatin-like phospholipase family protein [Verrucomicrobiae bacterium]
MSEQTTFRQDGEQAGEKSCFRVGYPKDVQIKEDTLVRARRAAAKAQMPRKEKSPSGSSKKPALLDSSIGLALSGGGIRSATFSLGILQSLARAKMLREVDYLSTVSGGGYIGGFLGRWFSRAATSAQASAATDSIEATLSDTQSPQIKWLREHGRYVTPTGGGDVLTAAAYVLRSWIALHFNLIPVILGLFCLLGYLRALMFDWSTWQNLERLAAPAAATHFWWSPWFILPGLVALLVCIPLGAAFWLSQALAKFRGNQTFAICASAAILFFAAGGIIQKFWPNLGLFGFGWSGVLVFVAVLTLTLPQFGDRGPYALTIIIALLLIYAGLHWSHRTLLITAITPMLSLVFYRVTLAQAEAAVRNKGVNPSAGTVYETEVRTKTRILLTERLGFWLLCFGISLGIAIIDTFGQEVWLNSHHTSLAVGSVGGFAAAVGLLHKFADKLFGKSDSGGSTRSLRALAIPALALILATAYLTSCAWVAQICLWGP